MMCFGFLHRFFLIVPVALLLQACDSNMQDASRASVDTTDAPAAESNRPLDLQYRPGEQAFEKALDASVKTPGRDEEPNRLGDLFEGEKKNKETTVSVKPTFTIVEDELVPAPSGAELKVKKRLD